MPETDATTGRKPALSIDQQIGHLKEKGVRFDLCGEEEAADYLAHRCNFFKLASYRKLFSKYSGGKQEGCYIALDFAQLRLLASLDQQLRSALLAMTLDIEHFQKVAILGKVTELGEDGYAIVSDYMASLNPSERDYRLRELRMSARSHYSAGVYEKYSGNMPVWAFLELTSFGTLIDFVRFSANRWDDKTLLSSHYDLKNVKSIRNCAAHGSCIINSFAERGGSKARIAKSVARTATVAKVSKATRSKWLSCPTVQQIATVLVVYSHIVPPGKSRNRTESELYEIFSRVESNTSLLPSNGPDSTVWAAFGFIKSLTAGLGLIESR